MARFSLEELEKWLEDDPEDLGGMLRTLALERKEEREKAAERAAIASRAMTRVWYGNEWEVRVGRQLLGTYKAGRCFDRGSVRKKQHDLMREQMKALGRLRREWRPKLDADHQERDLLIRYGLV